MDPAAQPLIDLATAFLAGELGAGAFEARYLATFKSIPVLNEETFPPLDNLFIARDRYVDDAELREPPDDLDEDGLRAEALAAMSRLGLA